MPTYMLTRSLMAQRLSASSQNMGTEVAGASGAPSVRSAVISVAGCWLEGSWAKQKGMKSIDNSRTVGYRYRYI
jgi:hypothetical protein